MIGLKEQKPTEEKEVEIIDKTLDTESNEQTQVKANHFEKAEQLAKVFNKDEKTLRDEMFLFAIKSLTCKLKKVIVNQTPKEQEIERLVLLSNKFSQEDIFVSPAFLTAVKRVTRKHLLEKSVKVGVIIDFPFGESLVRSKIISIRDCLKEGADKIMVTMPSSMLSSDNMRLFKRQCDKISRLTKKPVGIAINSVNLSEEQIKRIVKCCVKSKLEFITFVFNEDIEEKTFEKLSIISKYKSGKKHYVLGDFVDIEEIKRCLEYKVDSVLTCNSDVISCTLMEKFDIDY